MHDFDEPTPSTVTDDLLEQIEVCRGTNVAAVRNARRERDRARVIVLPADVRDRHTPLSEFETTDLTPLGVTGIAALPVMVGNVFMLRLITGTTTSTLSVCDRCTMYSDESFELRFRFVHPVEMDT